MTQQTQLSGGEIAKPNTASTLWLWLWTQLKLLLKDSRERFDVTWGKLDALEAAVAALEPTAPAPPLWPCIVGLRADLYIQASFPIPNLPAGASQFPVWSDDYYADLETFEKFTRIWYPFSIGAGGLAEHDWEANSLFPEVEQYAPFIARARDLMPDALQGVYIHDTAVRDWPAYINALGVDVVIIPIHQKATSPNTVEEIARLVNFAKSVAGGRQVVAQTMFDADGFLNSEEKVHEQIRKAVELGAKPALFLGTKWDEAKHRRWLNVAYAAATGAEMPV